MARLGLETGLIDRDVYKRTLARFREAESCCRRSANCRTPRPSPEAVVGRLDAVDPDAPHPLNLFRVHWFNDA